MCRGSVGVWRFSKSVSACQGRCWLGSVGCVKYGGLANVFGVRGLNFEIG